MLSNAAISIDSILSNLRWQDFLDIVLLSILAYHLFVWFEGTKALKAVVGLLVLGLIYTLSETWGLFLTTWVFRILWQVLVILIIVLFQSEIRQVLEKVNPLERIGLRASSTPFKWVPGLARALFRLAEKRTGALVILERRDRAEEWVTAGQSLEAEPTPELLESIFSKESPLHDGAVIVKNGMLVRAACYLPLSTAEHLPKEWGTRHRAGLGISEHCDALAVMVSEERGTVSVAREGQAEQVKSPEELSEVISKGLSATLFREPTWKEWLRQLGTHRWRAKLASLILICFLWLLLAGQQDFMATLEVPIEVSHLPSDLVIKEPADLTARIKVRGLRRNVSMLNRKNVQIQVEGGRLKPGKTTFTLGREDIVLPNTRVDIVDISPSRVSLTFAQRPKPQEGAKPGQ
jgi:uncharacterized protein (TIGR00159 family)